MKKAAATVALESSVGTWTDLTTVNKKTQKKITPKVYYLDPKNKRCRIAYPINLFSTVYCEGVLFLNLLVR